MSHLIYQCSNPACKWHGKVNAVHFQEAGDRYELLCPRCDHEVTELSEKQIQRLQCKKNALQNVINLNLCRTVHEIKADLVDFDSAVFVTEENLN